MGIQKKEKLNIWSLLSMNYFFNFKKKLLCDDQEEGDSGGGVWKGGSRGRGQMYIYGWCTLLYGRNQHNTVKQLSSN